MSLSKSPYKGTRDFFPPLKRKQDHLFDAMKKSALSFGYEPYDGPLLEEVELYKAKSGDELINEQIYSFHDRGDRFVAIRPEMTPTLARMVAQVHREAPKPLRWFSIPNLYRYERPQRGRLREHWQFNCDIFYAPGIEGELEILQLIIQLFESFGANDQHFGIALNDRKLVDQFFNDVLELKPDQQYILYKIIDRSKKITPEKLKEELSAFNFSPTQDQAFHDYLNLKSFEQLTAFVAKYKIDMSDVMLLKLFQALEETNQVQYFTYDPTIVRGLDYYTGIVFEAFDKHPNNRRALCGGGTYENLLKIFNEPAVAGTGVGLGDVTLSDFLSVHNLLPSFDKPENDLLVTFQAEKALPLVRKFLREVRQQQFKTVSHLEVIKMNKAFSMAEKKGARFISLMGTDEISQGTILIKNLKEKEQRSFDLNDIPSILKFLRDE